MADAPDDGPIEVSPFNKKDPSSEAGNDEIDLSEAREVNPFQIIQRGVDTVNSRGQVTFADFTPKVVPADTPEEIPVPKDESAQAPVPSQGSTEKPVQKKSEKNAPTPAS